MKRYELEGPVKNHVEEQPCSKLKKHVFFLLTEFENVMSTYPSTIYTKHGVLSTHTSKKCK